MIQEVFETDLNITYSPVKIVDMQREPTLAWPGGEKEELTTVKSNNQYHYPLS